MEHPPYKPDDAELASYVLGGLEASEALRVEAAVAADPELGATVESMRHELEKMALAGAETSPRGMKARLMGSQAIHDDRVGIDFPPYLNASSRPSDYEAWMKDALPELLASQEDFLCLAIGASDDTQTFLVRMCTGVPEETHTDELERLMVVSGYCDFIIGGKAYPSGPGSHYAIPMYTPHSAVVTTPEPCIFLVQRTQR